MTTRRAKMKVGPTTIPLGTPNITSALATTASTIRKPAAADGNEPDRDSGAAHKRGHRPPGVEPLPEKGEENRRQVGRRRDDERHPRDQGGGVGGGADTSRQPD